MLDQALGDQEPDRRQIEDLTGLAAHHLTVDHAAAEPLAVGRPVDDPVVRLLDLLEMGAGSSWLVAGPASSPFRGVDARRFGLA